MLSILVMVLVGVAGYVLGYACTTTLLRRRRQVRGGSARRQPPPRVPVR